MKERLASPRPVDRLTRLTIGALLLGALTLATLALAQAVAPTASLAVATAEDGATYVVDAEGRSLYLFLNDTSNVSNCSDACAANWPPVLVADAQALPTVSDEFDAALLGTAERADGTLQLTYNGWPLYYFRGDQLPGDTTGQGANDVWFLVTPQGTGLGRAADQPGGAEAPAQ